MIKIPLLIISFLIIYYAIFYQVFIHQVSPHEVSSPILINRLGTILWHSSDKDGVFWGNKSGNFHLYCYYPSSSINYTNKGGEYLIKKSEVLEDCQNWHGMAIVQEDRWVSEKEKLHWNQS